MLRDKIMINEGAVKFNREYIDKVEKMVAEHVDKYLIYNCINNYPKENLLNWIENIYGDNAKKINMLSDSIKLKMLQEVFNVYWKQFSMYMKFNIGIPKYIDWNRNDMFEVKIDVKKLTYEYVWKQNYDETYQLYINLDTDVPLSYKKYISKFIGGNIIKMKYIFTDNGDKYGVDLDKNQLGAFISNSDDFSNSYIVTNMGLASQMGNIKRIKYILLMNIKHELTHALQVGKFGKMVKFDPYYMVDFIEKEKVKNASTILDITLKREKLSKHELEITYPISVKEYKAMLYTYAIYFFTQYDTAKFSIDNIREFIKDNPLFFKNILKRYGKAVYKKVIGEFYTTLQDENPTKK